MRFADRVRRDARQSGTGHAAHHVKVSTELGSQIIQLLLSNKAA